MRCGTLVAGTLGTVGEAQKWEEVAGESSRGQGDDIHGCTEELAPLTAASEGSAGCSVEGTLAVAATDTPEAVAAAVGVVVAAADDGDDDEAAVDGPSGDGVDAVAARVPHVAAQHEVVGARLVLPGPAPVRHSGSTLGTIPWVA